MLKIPKIAIHFGCRKRLYTNGIFIVCLALRVDRAPAKYVSQRCLRKNCYEKPEVARHFGFDLLALSVPVRLEPGRVPKASHLCGRRIA